VLRNEQLFYSTEKFLLFRNITWNRKAIDYRQKIYLPFTALKKSVKCSQPKWLQLVISHSVSETFQILLKQMAVCFVFFLQVKIHARVSVKLNREV
jgi:hypothetical protein